MHQEYLRLSTEEKLARFERSLEDRRPIAFCVRCGSTRVDQVAIYKLRCSECDNSALWDGFSFSIAREGNISDVESAISNLETRDLRREEWHFAVVTELQNFSKFTINQSFVTQGRMLRKDGEAFDELLSEWNKLKMVIDRLLSV